MSRSLLAAGLMLISSSALAQTWTEHISEGGFRIEFPAPPELSSSTVGNNVRIFEAKLEGENRAYSASAVYLISLSEELRIDLESRAENNVKIISKMFIEKNMYKLIEERQSTVSGSAAYYMTYEAKDGYIGTYLYVEKNGNLYRVLSLGKPGIEDSEVVQRFFSSFVLIEKKREAADPVK